MCVESLTLRAIIRVAVGSHGVMLYVVEKVGFDCAFDAWFLTH